jgi:hypothetical protein
MKRSILTLALALAFSFTAAPADAAPTEEDRCKAQVVKADRKYSMCVAGVAARDLRFGQQTVGQATTINDCDSRRTKAYNKIDSKFPGDDFPGCGLDAASKAARAQATLVTAGLAEAAADITSDNAALCTDAGGTYDAGTDTCTVDITSDNPAIAAAAEQDGCEAANGTWDASVCTPAAVADRDCFREGACGVDGWNYGSYAGVTVSSTGCADTDAGSDSYTSGAIFSPSAYFTFGGGNTTTLTNTLCVTN